MSTFNGTIQSPNLASKFPTLVSVSETQLIVVAVLVEHLGRGGSGGDQDSWGGRHSPQRGGQPLGEREVPS